MIGSYVTKNVRLTANDDLADHATNVQGLEFAQERLVELVKPHLKRGVQQSVSVGVNIKDGVITGVTKTTDGFERLPAAT